MPSTKKNVKTCTECKWELPLHAYSVDKWKADGLKEVCRGCFANRRKKYPSVQADLLERSKNRKKYTSHHKEARAKLFNELLEKQEGHCYFCENANYLTFDKSGEALTCPACRYKLGVFRTTGIALEPFKGFLDKHG